MINHILNLITNNEARIVWRDMIDDDEYEDYVYEK